MYHNLYRLWDFFAFSELGNKKSSRPRPRTFKRTHHVWHKRFPSSPALAICFFPSSSSCYCCLVSDLIFSPSFPFSFLHPEEDYFIATWAHLIESKTIPFLHSTFERAKKFSGWDGKIWMDEMGIDCTTTSPFSFEKESGLLMERVGLGIKTCLFIACCAWVCYLIPGYGGWEGGGWYPLV